MYKNVLNLTAFYRDKYEKEYSNNFFFFLLQKKKNELNLVLKIIFFII